MMLPGVTADPLYWPYASCRYRLTPLWAYARATRCPRTAYALATRCPVLRFLLADYAFAIDVVNPRSGPLSPYAPATPCPPTSLPYYAISGTNLLYGATSEPQDPPRLYVEVEGTYLIPRYAPYLTRYLPTGALRQVRGAAASGTEIWGEPAESPNTLTLSLQTDVDLVAGYTVLISELTGKHIGLRACYAKPDTEIAHRAASVCLHACYAKTITNSEIAYGTMGTRVLRPRIVLPASKP
eukprot:866987-Rhodomonas_salina.3